MSVSTTFFFLPFSPNPLPSPLCCSRQRSGSVRWCPSGRALTGRLISLNLAVEQRRHRHSLPSPTHPADEEAVA
uniref:Uncharacterized protein n=1 Tax=Oryza nivara TaxID=4536 RepID=A0A0E0G9Y1_ORYNI